RLTSFPYRLSLIIKLCPCLALSGSAESVAPSGERERTKHGAAGRVMARAGRTAHADC
ncbi:hypothetical protein BaRGS_00002601, partial [Batillaria attramentaria]